MKLRRLLEAVLLLEGDLTLPDVLRHMIEEACAMTSARYGALGVLDETRTSLAEFVTVGLSVEEESAIGPRPTGRGVLGLLIAEPKPLRLAHISAHPQSSGFPPNHPPMTSFLGVPVTAHGEVYGNLYLTDKQGWSEFTQDDEWLAMSFAQAAGVAIENARLHQRVQEVAVLEDRDRIARDLHDDVIHRLFAVGLALQALERDFEARAAERLDQVIGDIDSTIHRIRSAIFELVEPKADRGIRAAVLALVHDLRPLLGFDPSVSFSGPVDTAITPEMTGHLLATVREALTNVARHSNATGTSVQLTVAEGVCTLAIVDNGTGVVPTGTGPTLAGGFGIANLRRRAEKLGGELDLDPGAGGGIALTMRVPIA